MLDRLLDDVMDDVIGAAFGTGAQKKISFDVPVDVRSGDDAIVFVCDVPGIEQDKLEIWIEGNTLTVKGERSFAGSDNEKVWLGRAYGAFAKSFTLPDLVDADAMTAELADGVLTIRVPKKPQAKPRKIPIGSGGSHQQLTAKKEEG
jgi:HSP20 family protein